MKPRLKPRMFPEAGECLHDDQSFEEQMADLGVGIIRRKKEEVPVMNREEVSVMDREYVRKTTIGGRIDELGLKGLLTVNQVIDVPKERLIALLEKGYTNTEMADRLDIGTVTVSRLRKFYDLPGKPGSKPRDAMAPKPKGAATEVLPEPEFLPPPETEPLPVPESRWVPGHGCPEPVLRQEQTPHEIPCLRCACETVPKPLLDITDTGMVLAPLAAGVSKMLERIGEGQCRLIITVERV